MRFMFRSRTAVCLLAAAATVLVAIPATASASTLWVSSSPVKAPYNSCTSPGYNSIQAAVEGNASAPTVHVCAGTYAEQLVIKKGVTIIGANATTLTLPNSPAEATSSCAAAGEQDLVDICTQGAETVKISNITFEALWPAGTCNDNLYGINAGGGATLVLTGSTMDGAGAHPVNGCQGGVGIQIGRGHTSQVATATLTEDSISEYQKNGITVDNTGSKATIKHVIVTGAGPVSTAQNGIQVSRGATAKISESTITGNECEAPSCGNGSIGALEEDAAGVLFYLEGKGSAVTKSNISNNDLGVSHLAGEESTRPQAAITTDELVEDRYASVMLGQGNATVSKDKMSKGTVGILVLQYEGQEFGPKGTGAEDTVSEMTSFAVEGLSDNNTGDQFGSFKIANSHISGNPSGADVKESVSTNNPSKLKIITSASDS